MAHRKTDDRQMTGVEEPERAQKALEPVKLRTSHDYTLATHALESHVQQLKKLSEKNDDAGYPREAKSIQADADAIEYHILPAFRAQRELPLVTTEQMEKEIAHAIRTFVHRAFVSFDDHKFIVTSEIVRNRKDALTKTLSEKIAAFARDVADRSFNEGIAARETTPEALAIRCVKALKDAD